MKKLIALLLAVVMVLGLVAGGLAFLAEWGLYTELYNVAGTVSLSSFHLLSFDVLRWWVLAVYCGAGALFGIGGTLFPYTTLSRDRKSVV